ncbi:MAG: flagellar biosynthetic protein FliR [Oscillospiraceae bacterium]
MTADIFGTGQVFLFVFARFSGMVLLNPIFSRKNLPQTFKMGFVLMLTLLVAPNLDSSFLVDMASMDKVTALLKELSVGMVGGMVFDIFYYLLLFAGDFIDMQLGLSMAKTFDPGSNIQISISGKIITLLFFFYFFASDSHLMLIKIFATSFEIIPAGAAGFNLNFAEHMLKLFASIFTLAFKLSLPFVIAEFTIEAALGILMRVVPQISVFVVSMQLRILVGLTLMIAYAPAISSFTDKYITLLLQNTMAMLRTLA